jgi:hypothetical protein
MDVQTFVAEPSFEGLDEGIFHGFPRPNEIELHAACVGPGPATSAVRIADLAVLREKSDLVIIGRKLRAQRRRPNMRRWPRALSWE